MQVEQVALPSPQPTSVQPLNLETDRLQKIKEQLAKLPNLSLSPSSRILRALCTLNPQQFSSNDWTVHHLEDRHYSLARKGDALEIVVPLRKLQKSQKSAWEAVKITFENADVRVQHIFRSTTALTDPFTSTQISAEANLRLHCNNLRHFPVLREFGLILGRSKKSPCMKLLMIEDFHPSNLLQYLTENGQIFDQESLIVPMLITLLEALKDLHTTHVHADMKTQNILVGPNGLLLADLGFAVPIHEVKDKRLTPAWASPEIVLALFVKSSFEYNPSIDMWGFALIAYELLHKLIGMERVPKFRKAQMNLIRKKAPIKATFNTWRLAVLDFIVLINKNPHPLAKWLGSMFKWDPALRATSEQALKELENYPEKQPLMQPSKAAEIRAKLLQASHFLPTTKPDPDLDDFVFVEVGEEEPPKPGGHCTLL